VVAIAARGVVPIAARGVVAIALDSSRLWIAITAGRDGIGPDRIVVALPDRRFREFSEKMR